MSVKYKRRAPAKVIVMGVLFVVMALAATAGIVTVLALTSRSINSNVNIMYTAVDIDGEVEAAYKIGDSGTWTSMNGSTPYRFSADDQTSNKQMNPANIELTSQNRYVEFRYIFRNYGHVDYTAILSLNEVDENNNIKLDYKYNNKSYTPTGYGLVIEGTNSPVAGKVQTNEDGEEYVEMTYYVKASVKQLTRDANYQSDFYWLLENYEAQPGEETIRLATSNYTDNGDGTFSASYSGANISVASMMTDSSTPNVENIWNVPSRFGSASVTKVTKGDDLPANTKVVLSDSITTIGEDTFSGLGMKAQEGLVEIVLGKGLTEIDPYSFANCVNLNKVVIPEGVKTINSSAFEGCSSLKEITIPSSVEYFGSSVFSNCVNMETLNFNVTYNGDPYFWTSPFSMIGSNATRTVVNMNSNIIPGYFFCGCEYIDEINISSRVTSIGEYALYGCSSLKEITIPSSVTSIGNSAFQDCTAVEELNYNASIATAFTSTSQPFKDLGKNATRTVVNINSTVIPDNLLYQCSGVDEVNISDNVTSIGSGAFYYCSGLTSVVIPNSVTSIGTSAFNSCSGLTSVVIPNSVTSMGSYAFSSCKGLTSVVIGRGVTSIGNSTFEYCTSLTNIVIGSEVASIGSNAFSSCSGLTSVVIPNSVTSIGNNAFSSCSGLTGVVIPNSVTSIGSSAFQSCSGLTSVEIGSGVTSIGSSAFSICSGLTSVVIPNSVTSIGNNAFSSCFGLTSVVIGSGVTSIGSNAFSSCYKLVEIYDLRTTQMTAGSYGTNSYAKILGSGANSVIHTDSNGIQYFEYETGKCKVIGYTGTETEITIPSTYNGKSVTEIIQYAFYNNKNIMKVVISSGITTLGECSFQSCSKLISVTIPSTVTSIGAVTFASSTLLMEIYDLRTTQMTAGNYGTQSYAKILKAGDSSVALIDANGLVYCEYETNKLQVLGYIGTASELVIPSTFNGKSVIEIANSAFANNKIIKKVTISSGIKSIGSYAFGYCSNLSEIVIESGLESITQSFYQCSSLKTIWIPATVTTIKGSLPTFPFNTYCEVYCEAESKPSGWNEVSSSNTVFKFGYTYAEYLAEINK